MLIYFNLFIIDKQTLFLVSNFKFDINLNKA
jgi:hypothetical protein